MTRRSYCSTSFLPVELKTPSFKTLDYRGAAGGATGTGGGVRLTQACSAIFA